MRPLVIKLGGLLLDNATAMNSLFTLFAHYQQEDARPLIIVHGGGALVDDLMKRLGLQVCKKKWA